MPTDTAWTPSPVDLIPEPDAIRRRLSELACEANLLRALLRLWESRECGRYVLQQRRRRQQQQEVCHAR